MHTVNLDAKPYYEIIDGELVAKYGEDSMSAQRRHQTLSEQMWLLLRDWVGEAGEAHTDWRFIMPSDERRESYLPDAGVLFFAHASGDVRTYGDGERFAHPAMPGFTLDVTAFFDSANLSRRPRG